MPSFVIDEVYVGDVVSGQSVLRGIEIGGAPPSRILPPETFPTEPYQPYPSKPVLEIPYEPVNPELPEPSPRRVPDELVIGDNGCPTSGRLNDYWANNIRCNEFWKERGCAFVDYRDGWAILDCPTELGPPPEKRSGVPQYIVDTSGREVGRIVEEDNSDVVRCPEGTFSPFEGLPLKTVDGGELSYYCQPLFYMR